MAGKKYKAPRSDRGASHRFTDANRQRATERLLQARPVEVTLRARHTIAGQTYGPGPVKVPKALVDLLMEQERNALAADASFFGTKAGIVGARGRVTLVPAEMFDTYYMGAPPSASIGGRDWAGQPIPEGGVPV